MKVLITDGENRSALAAVRSLGRKGHDVFVAGGRARSLAAASRYCKSGFQVPDPFLNRCAYGEAIKGIVNENKIDIVLPVTDQSIQLLSEIRSELEGAAVACPPHGKVQSVSNKYELFRLAREKGVAIPDTHFLDSCVDLPRVAKQINHYPVVVKPAFSKRIVGEHFISGRVNYADNFEDLRRLYSTEKSLQYPSLIQERIEGPGTGLFTLFSGDKHLALFSHQRLREKPPSGGVSVVCQSVPLDEEMVDASRQLLAAIGWRGVAMVEFKRDLRDGKAKLMEINGRFWGSLQLAVFCGVDFPSLLIDYLEGKNIACGFPDYRQGVKMKWILGTLDHLLIRLKNDPLDLNLPAGAPSKWGAVREFLRFWGKDTTFDVFDCGDIGPFKFELAEYLRHMCRLKTRAAISLPLEKST